MKNSLSLLLSVSLAGFAHAGFEDWTNKAGKTVELDLQKVSKTADGHLGEFKMRNGLVVKIKSEDLSEEDAARLAEWTPASANAAAEAGAGPASVFDSVLDGNLVALKGRSLVSKRDMVKPAKYYLFYYTASWCGPCQKFTPSLVDFYESKKPGNKDFEIILVTSDDDEESMTEYAVQKKMTWPHVKLSKVSKFEKEFKHPGNGIPNLVLTDIEGKLLKTSYEGDKYLGPTVVMNHLAELLNKPAAP